MFGCLVHFARHEFVEMEIFTELSVYVLLFAVYPLVERARGGYIMWSVSCFLAFRNVPMCGFVCDAIELRNKQK